jgi:hypothetical protein
MLVKVYAWIRRDDFVCVLWASASHCISKGQVRLSVLISSSILVAFYSLGPEKGLSGFQDRLDQRHVWCFIAHISQVQAALKDYQELLLEVRSRF